MVRFGIICAPTSVKAEIDNLRLADEVGFSMLGVGDSQSVRREVYVMVALAAQATRHALIGPSVTNPVTRHPAVAASAICTIDEASNGRAFLGVGSGDSAVLNLGERPATLGALREYFQVVRALMRRQEVELNGKRIRCTWPARPVPLYVSAEGPKTLEMAGEVCDGVFMSCGITPELLREAVDHVHAGARRAGRDSSEIDIWTMVRINVCDDVQAGLHEIKADVAHQAHHVFRFVQSKHVPPDMVEAIDRLERDYGVLGAVPSTGSDSSIDRYPELLAYLADRFAIVGPPEYCVERIRTIAEAGVKNLIFTGMVRDRARLIRLLGERVLPQVN